MTVIRGLLASPFCRAAAVTILSLSGVSLFGASLSIGQGAPGSRTVFNVAWSPAVGLMPWDYAEQSGILKKWADRYGIKIQLTRIADYVDAVNQYTAGSYDACVMTNVDMLTVPAADGVDSTALIVGDYSNGSDGIVLKGAGKHLADIKGQTVNLVELSVSHYLLDRGLALAGLKERDVHIANTADATLVGAFAAPGGTSAVAWKPQLAAVLATPRATLVFDSSQIPGEILDLLVVNSRVLRENPKLGKALVGAWYETLAHLQGEDAAAREVIQALARARDTDPESIRQRLATTHLYGTPPAALAATLSAELPEHMDRVRQFSYEHGLLGAAARSVDEVGIEFPGGRTLGNSHNIKMRFDASYVRLAADGKL